MLVVAALQRLLTAWISWLVIGPDRLISKLLSHDAFWYKQIAETGYSTADGLQNSSLAFHPLYPMLVKLVQLLPGVSTAGAMIGLGALGSVLAAVPIFAIGSQLHSREVGWYLALLWGALPQSVVLIMGYPEGLFTAASAFALLFMLQYRPLPAAVAAVVAGLLHPAALALVLVMVVWCITQAVWERDWRYWGLPALVAPLGLVGYMLFVGSRSGEWLGYFTVQRLQHGERGWPWQFLHQISELLNNPSQFTITVDMHIPIIVANVMLLIMLLGRWREAEGYSWLIAYALVASLLVLSHSSYFWTDARQLLPVFPLLLPLATIRTSRWAWIVTIVAMTAATAWFGATILEAGRYAI